MRIPQAGEARGMLSCALAAMLFTTLLADAYDVQDAYRRRVASEIKRHPSGIAEGLVCWYEKQNEPYPSIADEHGLRGPLSVVLGILDSYGWILTKPMFEAYQKRANTIATWDDSRRAEQLLEAIAYLGDPSLEDFFLDAVNQLRQAAAPLDDHRWPSAWVYWVHHPDPTMAMQYLGGPVIDDNSRREMWDAFEQRRQPMCTNLMHLKRLIWDTVGLEEFGALDSFSRQQKAIPGDSFRNMMGIRKMGLLNGLSPYQAAYILSRVQIKTRLDLSITERFLGNTFEATQSREADIATVWLYTTTTDPVLKQRVLETITARGDAIRDLLIEMSKQGRPIETMQAGAPQGEGVGDNKTKGTEPEKKGGE